MKIKMVAQSDIGKVRNANEDFCGIFEEEKFALVCDGMGGHNAGSQASRLAVSTIRYAYTFLEDRIHSKIVSDLNNNYQRNAKRLISAIRLANRHIYNRACKNPEFHGMGTTVSALAFSHDGLAFIAHVGDSRVYRFRNGTMERLTEDHSWLNELIQDNEIKKEDALQFEKKNVITRALGLSDTVKIDIKLDNTEQEDLFLLCSDGLTDSLSDDQIEDILKIKPNDLNWTAFQLIQSANQAKGADNISVVLVTIKEKGENGQQIVPATLSIKNENTAISASINRVLRKEFNKNPISTFIDIAAELWEKKTVKAIVIGLFVLLIFLLVKNPFISSREKDTVQLNEGTDIQLTENFVATKAKKNREVSVPSTNEINKEQDSGRVSQEKNVIVNESIIAKSLGGGSDNSGRIYILGLEKLSAQKKTFLFLNNHQIGYTTEYLESGIQVKPGYYRIAIKDSNDTVLFQYDRINIVAGDTKAIEYKAR